MSQYYFPLSLEEHKSRMITYNIAGSKCYRHWLGCPRTNEKYTDVIFELTSYLIGLAATRFEYCEIGPCGGRWTFAVLKILEEHGFPIITNLHFVGSQIEFEMTKNDTLRHWSSRVRTYKTPGMITTLGTLISEINSRFYEYDFLNAKVPTFVDRFDLMVSFDFLPCLNNSQIKRVGKFVGSNMRNRSFAMLQLRKDQLEIIAETLYSFNVEYVCCLNSKLNDNTVYVTFNKKGTSQ